jgi:hypothetical protein
MKNARTDNVARFAKDGYLFEGTAAKFEITARWWDIMKTRPKEVDEERARLGCFLIEAKKSGYSVNRELWDYGAFEKITCIRQSFSSLN